MNASGNYSNRPWSRDTFQRPNASYEDSMTAAALSAAMGEPAESIRERRPPMPIQLFPPRLGYRTTALGIADIVQLDSIYQRTDFSGRQSGYSSSSYPSLNQW